MAAAKTRLGFLSSLATSRWTIFLALAFSLLANWAGMSALGAFLFFLFLLGTAARGWGRLALRRVRAVAAADQTVLSVGEALPLTYTVENDKLLPLVWLELWQPVPPRDCLVPTDGFSRRTFTGPEAEAEGTGAVYRRHFLFLMGGQTLRWETLWRAERRGVYRLNALSLRSGDGFGLTQIAALSPLPRPLTLVVWPRLVPVSTAPFFRNVWQGETGRQGWVEDPTVLRGLRDYQPGDSWRRIDWRTAARQDELQTRLYETIRPSTLHFILDAASFTEEDLEEAISLTASLILELDRQGVCCGLSLPGAGQPVTLSPEDTGVEAADLMLALSEFQPEPGAVFDQEALSALSLTVGQLWLVTHSGTRLGCPELADRLAGAGLSVLCADPLAPGPLAGRTMLPLSAVKGGDAP